MIEKSLGERLKIAIRMLGFNQKEFCERISIKQSTLSGIISGNSPTSDTLQSIAKIGINAHWLITGEGEMLLIPKMEKANELTEIKQELPSSRKAELILKLMERFSRMDIQALRRWEKVVAAMVNEEVVETPQHPEPNKTEHGTS